MSGYSINYYRDAVSGDVFPNRGKFGAMYVTLVDTAGNPVNPGGGGGGGGDASAANQLSMQGSVAPGVAATKSVLTGCVYSSTLQVLTAGQQIASQCDQNGNAWARLKGSGAAGLDAVGNFVAYISGNNQPAGNAAMLPVGAMVFNGATWDRPRGDITGAFVVGAPSAGTDRSLATSVTAAVLMAANPARHGFYVVNDTAIDVWINVGGTATATPGSGNIRIAANGGRYESGNFTASAAISIIASSGAPAITAREF